MNQKFCRNQSLLGPAKLEPQEFPYKKCFYGIKYCEVMSQVDFSFNLQLRQTFANVKLSLGQIGSIYTKICIFTSALECKRNGSTKGKLIDWTFTPFLSN